MVSISPRSKCDHCAANAHCDRGLWNSLAVNTRLTDHTARLVRVADHRGWFAGYLAAFHFLAAALVSDRAADGGFGGRDVLDLLGNSCRLSRGESTRL